MPAKKKHPWKGPKGATFEEYMTWLAKQPRPPFKPSAWYNREGDIIDVMWKDCDYYAEWLNHQVTLMRDQKTKEIVGVQVWALDDDDKNALISKVVKRESAAYARSSAAWKRKLERAKAKPTLDPGKVRGEGEKP